MKLSMKSRLLATLLAISMILGSMPFFAVTATAADIAAGSGSAEDPYQITSADELMAYNDIVNGGNRGASAILMADIDMEGKDWRPLGVYSDVGGYSEGTYSGTFNGNGYIISNLTIYCDTPIETGFVSRSQGATLKNITIVNASVTNTASTRSGILGGELYVSTVENCFTHGTVTITDEAKILGPSGGQKGGIAGEAASTTLRNCATSMSVIANGSSYENCFYVAESDNDGLNGTTNIPSADMIATGEAAYIMNETLGSTVWYQNIDATETADLAPVASNAGGRGQVYKVDVFACPNNTTLDVGDTFSNTNENQTKDKHSYTDGICDYCDSQVTAGELATARADAKEKLNAYVSVDDYREAEQAELASAISDAEAAIDVADTYEEIDAALEAGKTAIDGIKTNDDYLREELESYMAPKREELQNYVDKTLYREAQQALIDQAIADGIAEINKGTSEAAIDEALAAAKAVIDEIPDDLDMYKSEAIDALESYKDSGLYRQSDYLPVFNAGKNAILACEDKDAVDAALETAKAAIDELKTDEEISAEEQETEPNMVLTNKSFETGSFSGWNKQGGSPEVVLASEEEIDDGKYLATAAHGDYAVKLPGGALFNRYLCAGVPGTSYKLTFYVYDDANMSGLKGRTPNVWLGSSTWDPNPFCGTNRQYTPVYVNTTEQADGWVKYEMTYPAFPYNDDGSIPALYLSARNWTGTTYYLDNFKVEAIDPVYAVNFTDKAVDDIPEAFSPLTVTDTTGTNAVKALKLDTDAEVIVPLDASKLTVDKWYSVMVGTANRTDFVAEPAVDSEVKVNLYTKVDGNWVDAGVGTTVKASDLFAYAGNNTAARMQLMTHNKFRLPSAASGEYALGLKYTNGDVGMDLTYITMANIHIPDVVSDLFLYDGFDYEVTEGAEDGVRLQSFGEKGGYWPSTWGFAEDRGVIESGSVYYEDTEFNMLKTSGNKMHHGWPWECNMYRTFALKDAYNNIDIATDNGELGLAGTTVYASFLFNNENSNPRFAFSKGGGTYRFGNAGWYPSMNNPAIHIQIDKNTNDEKVFKLMDSNAQEAGQSVLSDVKFENGKTYFMVLKMEFGTENKFSLYVNPSLNGEPETADAVLTNNMTYALDSILVDGMNTFNNLFDEFRLAKTYAAAAPSAGVNLVSKGKVEGVAEINSYLNPDEYRDAEKETIVTTIATWTETINACTTVEDIETALANAKAALDDIKTDAELTAEELAAAKVEAIDELKAYKSADAYRDAEKAQLADAIAAGEAAINACTVIDDVPTALANAKAAIDAIKTDAQYLAEELAAAKVSAKAELDSYKNADDYRDAQKTELANAISAGKTAIDACTVIADVPTALANAKAAMDAIKTNAQLTAEELAKAKEDAVAVIDEYKAENYRDAEKVTLEQAIADAKAAIEACTVIDDVATALESAKATLDAIKTDAEYDLEEAIAAAKEELDQYKNADDYRDAEKESLADAIEEAKAALDAAESIDEVNSLLADAKSSMDEIKTDAQLTLEEAKAAAIAELESYKNPDDYREAEKEALAAAIAEAKVAIEAATDADGIATALSSAKGALDVIKTDAQLKDEEAKATPVPTTAPTAAVSTEPNPSSTPNTTATASPTTTPDVTPTPAVKKVKKVKFTKKKIKIKKGKKVTLKVKLTPTKGLSKAAKKVKWSINKKGKKIVKFVKKAKKLNGKLKAKIKAVKKGKAKVTCKAPSGKKAVCKITVK